MKVVIVEDEKLVAQELKLKIRELAPDVEVLRVLSSLKGARSWLAGHAEPDLWFMDIQLSDGVSFKLFEEFSLQAPVVFTTAYDEYAVKAFKVNGVDYLLKPVDSLELKRAIEKCRSIIESRQAYPAVVADFLRSLTQTARLKEPRYKQKFIVHSRQSWQPVNTPDIAAFEKEAILHIHTFQGERFVLTFESMEEIEELLDPSSFFRANRQWIVGLESVKSVRPLENFKLAVTLKFPVNREIVISREKSAAFRRWLDR